MSFEHLAVQNDIGALAFDADLVAALDMDAAHPPAAEPAANRGAFVYQRGSGKPVPNLYATAEAVPAVMRAPFPIRRATATVTRAPMTCKTR